MGLVVQKYGGSSVSDAERIKRVAERIVATRKAGHDVVRRRQRHGRHHRRAARPRAAGLARCRPGRELDMLLTAGERISMALLAMAIQTLGLSARGRSPAARPASSPTPCTARRASSTSRRAASSEALGDGPRRDRRRLPGRQPGHQGHHHARPRRLRHHRGGARRRARRRGLRDLHRRRRRLLSADPRLVPTARQLPTVSYEEMLELAACGAKILHLRCVEYARRYGVRLVVRSSFSTKPGTTITGGRTRGAGHHQRGRARPVRGAGHGRRRPRQAGRGGQRSSAPSPTPRSTST